MKKILLCALIAVVFTACFNKPTGNTQQPPSHDAYTELLQKHVNEAGWVDYKGLMKDREKLDSYLRTLSNFPASPKWNDNEKMAYWINVYNAFTLQLILDHYPLKSIKDIGASVQIPFVNTPWQKNFFSIGGESMNLDQIEHKILLKEFNEPRIHFALVCASRSCAPLRQEAYTAEKMEAQLTDQAKRFLLDKNRNEFSKDKVEVSKYFTWYKKDFTKNGTVIDYLNKYAPIKINANATINYKDYNWNLNEQQ